MVRTCLTVLYYDVSSVAFLTIPLWLKPTISREQLLLVVVNERCGHKNGVA